MELKTETTCIKAPTLKQSRKDEQKSGKLLNCLSL